MRLYKYLPIKKCLIFLGVFFIATSVFASPTVNNVAAGQVSIQQNQNTTVINQTSANAIINWKNFNIKQAESVQFRQPTGGATLNRISGAQGASQIYGKLTANGQIILVNPAGIYFGPTAFVSVGRLIATTADIRDQDFLNRNYKFSQASPYSGSIVNDGEIIAQDHGLVALVAPGVINNGKIQANLGYVALASGETFTLNFSGDQLINFAVTTQTSKAGVDKDGRVLRNGVENTGSVLANGGKVLVSADAASGVLDQVINMQGMVSVQSVGQQNGDIILSGNSSNGVVRIAAKLDASGKNANQSGGNITITGYQILVDSGSTLDVSGSKGGGNIYIGGNYQGKGPLPHANAVVIAPNSQLIADAINTGNGGNVIVWSDALTKVYSDISARGGALSGNGGFVETSSHGVLQIGNINVRTLAAHGNAGSWLLDPYNVYITSTGSAFTGNTFTPTSNDATISNTTIQNNLNNGNVTITTGSTGSQAGNITVNADIVNNTTTNTLLLNAAGSIAINANISLALGTLQLQAGTNTSAITATGAITVNKFNLLRGAWTQNTATLPSFIASSNFTIASGAKFLRATSGTGTTASPYTINDLYGLQGMGSSPLLNSSFSLTANIDASSTSTWNNGAGFVRIGYSGTPYTGVFNGNNYTINGLYINTPTDVDVALFGNVIGGTIKNVGVTHINLTGLSYVGGLVGYMVNSSISNAYTTGNINVSSSGINAGGLVGLADSGTTISNSHSSVALKNVSGGSANNSIGGLVGRNIGTITNSYSTGSVSMTGINSVSLGGLVGDNFSNISNSYSTAAVTGGSQSSALLQGWVGGFIGRNDSGIVSNSYSTGTVTVDNNAIDVGGFIGLAFGTISNSYSSSSITAGKSSLVAGFIGGSVATVSNSYSLGKVSITGSGFQEIGGFVGRNQSGTISNSYSMSPVVLNGTGNMIGGFAGQNMGTLTNVYSTGATVASGSTNVGGLVGLNSGAVNNSFWNTETSGLTNSAAGTGKTTAQLFQQSTYAAWSFSSTWGIINGQSFPYLKVFYPTTPRAISGTSPVGAGSDVNFSSTNAAGNAFTDTAYAGAAASNGFYYFLEGTNAISSINQSLNDATPFIVYFPGATKANAIALASINGGSLTGLNINAANTLLIGGSLNVTNDDLQAVSNGLSADDLLYSVSNSILTLGTSTNHHVNFITSSTLANYIINHDILTISGGASTATFNGNVKFQGANLTTTGSQNYYGAVTLDNNSVLNTTTGDVLFYSSINSHAGTGLTINTGTGNIVLNAVGNNSNPLGDLILNSAATTTLNGSINAASLTAQGGGTLVLNNGNITTTNNQTYNNAIILANNANLIGNTLTFNAAVSGNYNLALTGNNLILNNGSINTHSGNQIYNGNITLGANTSLTGFTFTFNGNINGNANLNVIANNIILNGSVNTNNGTQFYSGPITINGNSSFTGSTITINDIINSYANVAFNGLLYFNGGNVNTHTGNQTYTGGIILGADTTFTGGNIAISNGMQGGMSANIIGNQLTVNGDLALNHLTLNGNNMLINSANLRLTDLTVLGNGNNNSFTLTNSNNQQ